MKKDYCKKLLKEKRMDEKADRRIGDAIWEGYISGIKWGLILGIPFFWFMITYVWV